MRMLHTSDWHLGRSFHGVGLLSHQAAFLDDLVEVVRSERVNAVLVSGDVYDRALPAPETVEVLSESVTRMIDAGAQVILSSGNHDSAIRLGFASGLLERAGLHVRTSLADIGRPVEIGGVAIHPLPYLEPSLAAVPLGAESASHDGVLRAAMDRVRMSLDRHAGPSVVMAHAFVTGAMTSESERDITVGGVASVAPSVFADIDYVALGHLHGRQQAGSEAIRYSGSPLAMSFGESGHVKGTWLVDLDVQAAPGSRLAAVDAVPAAVPRRLAVLRGNLDDLLRDPRHRDAEQAWCQVTLTDSVPPLAAMEQVRSRFPHTLDLRFDPVGARTDARSYTERIAQGDELDLCCDFLAHVRGGAEATQSERMLLQNAIEGSRRQRQTDEDEGQVSLPGLGQVGAA